MYNGIGLKTPRGSGTNGYIQRNKSFVKQSSFTRRDEYPEERPKERKINLELFEHQLRREVEAKVYELQVKLEIDGLGEDEIESRTSQLREKLLDEIKDKKPAEQNKGPWEIEKRPRRRPSPPEEPKQEIPPPPSVPSRHHEKSSERSSHHHGHSKDADDKVRKEMKKEESPVVAISSVESKISIKNDAEANNKGKSAIDGVQSQQPHSHSSEHRSRGRSPSRSSSRSSSGSSRSSSYSSVSRSSSRSSSSSSSRSRTPRRRR